MQKTYCDRCGAELLDEFDGWRVTDTGGYKWSEEATAPALSLEFVFYRAHSNDPLDSLDLCVDCGIDLVELAAKQKREAEGK